MQRSHFQNRKRKQGELTIVLKLFRQGDNGQPEKEKCACEFFIYGCPTIRPFSVNQKSILVSLRAHVKDYLAVLVLVVDVQFGA